MSGIKALAGTLWVWLYRPLGALLLVGALYVATIGSVNDTMRVAGIERALASVGLRATGSSVGEVHVAPFDARMARAGIPRGRLYAIDLEPIGEIDRENDALREKLTRNPDGLVRLTIINADDIWHLVTVRRGAVPPQPAWQLWFTAIIGVTGGLAIWAALLLLYLRRPRDRVSAMLVVSLCTAAILMTPEIALPIDAGMRDLALAVAAMGAITALTMFPNGRLRIAIPVVIGMVVLIAVLDELAVNSDWVAFTIPAAVVLLRFAHTPPGTERQQMKWGALGLAGLALFLVLDIVANAYADATIDPAQREPLLLLGIIAVQLGNFAFAGGMLIALLRFRLYDAEAAISRSAAYAVLTITLVAAFATIEKLIELAGEGVLGGPAAQGMAAAVAAALIAPMHQRITGWAEARFQRALIRLRREVPPRLGDMRSVADIAGIGALVAGSAAEATRAQGAVVTMGDRVIATHGVAETAAADWLARWQPPQGVAIDRDRGDPDFPLRVALTAEGPGTVGWLLLAPRPDGSGFGKDEREALAAIAEPVARALAVARERKAREEQQAALARSLAERVAAVEAALARLAPGLAQ